MSYSVKEIKKAIKPENFVGAGAGRATFQLDVHNVVKIPRGLFSDQYLGNESCKRAIYQFHKYSSFGAAQTEMEIDVYLNYNWGFGDILCPILQIEPIDDSYAIIMPKVETFDREIIKQACAFASQYGLFNLEGLCTVLDKRDTYKTFAKQVKKLEKLSGMESTDILDNLTNVGIYNGNLVAIDYGLYIDPMEECQRYSYDYKEDVECVSV